MTTTAERTQQSPIRRAAGQLLAALVGAVVGGTVAVLAIRYLPDLLPDTGMSVLEKGVALVALLVLLVGVVAVHEVGHLLGGWIAGFRAVLFVVGPLRVERTGTRVRVELNRSVAMAGGLAASVPEDTRDLRRRTLLMIAGGPGISLLSGGAALALREPLGLASLPPGAGFGHALVVLAVAMYGLASLAIGVVTLVPNRADGFYSDGARILRLLRSGPDTDREVAILAITGLTMSGRRPRDWDPALVAKLLAVEDSSAFEAVARQFAYSHALDRGETDEARRHLDVALALEEEVPSMSRPALLLEAAYFAAVHDRDAARARALFARAGDGLLVPPYQRIMAEAAVCLAEGDPRRAVELLAGAEAQLDGSLDRGGAVVDLERIRALRAAAAGDPAGAGAAAPA